MTGNRGAGVSATTGRGQAGAGGLGVLCGLLLILGGCGSSPSPGPPMADSLLLKPVDGGRLSSPFGMRRHPVLKRWQMHRGIDWAAPRGTPVRAAGHGLVVAAGPLGSYGRYLRIDHGGTIATAYGHLDRYAKGLRPGQSVRQGDLIGEVGSSGRATGPHLHYEVLVGGRQIDPLAFAPARAVQAVAPTGAAPGIEPAIGGPDLPATAAADSRTPATRPDRSAVLLDALTAPARIRTQDLLGLAP